MLLLVYGSSFFEDELTEHARCLIVRRGSELIPFLNQRSKAR